MRARPWLRSIAIVLLAGHGGAARRRVLGKTRW
jgi:hypothetical protein